MAKAKVIVFDFDGTLVDTRAAYVEMLGRAFDRFGIRVRSAEVSRTLVPTIKGTIERLLMRTKRYEAQLVHKLEHETIELLGTRWVKNVVVKKDMIELLAKLNEKGSTVYLASNSHSSFVLPALKKFDLEQYFREVITLDSGYNGKHEMLTDISQRSGCALKSLVYVGDTRMDIEMAEELGCRLVLLITKSSWDFDKKSQLVEAAKGKKNVKVAFGLKEAEELLV
ncbi:MAG: HAD family hydrolase [Thermoplasmata archaeon]|nr:MAG: HAD family hydrolase [Thermoplasmata archaeon]